MLFYIIFFYIILNTQYFFYETTPLIGRDVRMAYIGEFPFIVSLSLKYQVDSEKGELDHFCGGSLITHSHVLTAAHCLKNKQPKDVVVKIGSVDLRNCDTYELKWWEKYSDRTYVQVPANSEVDDIYDIAVVKLKNSVGLHMELPILSYTDITNLTGRSATTGGWGVLDRENKRARFMRVAQFFILRPEKCGAFTLLKDTFLRDVRSKVFLCSQALPFALTTCGDSGSPLFIDEHRLIGINTRLCFPKNANTSTIWNLHSFVSAYEDFIEEMKRKN